MAPNLQKFCRALAVNKLVSLAELEKHYRQWRANAPEQRDNVKSFAKSLVQAGKISAEQVAQLLKDNGGTAESSMAPAPTPTIDVELIAVSERGRRIDRRDLLFALGGAAISAVIVVPTMLLTRSKK